MEKIIPGHLIGFGSLKDMEEYEDYIYFGGAMSIRRSKTHDDTPSKEECAALCAALSGEVIVYNISREIK